MECSFACQEAKLDQLLNLLTTKQTVDLPTTQISQNHQQPVQHFSASVPSQLLSMVPLSTPMSAGGPSRSLEITMTMLFQQLPILNVSDFCLSGHFVYFGGFASTIAIQGIWTHPLTLLITIAILDIGVISGTISHKHAFYSSFQEPGSKKTNTGSSCKMALSSECCHGSAWVIANRLHVAVQPHWADCHYFPGHFKHFTVSGNYKCWSCAFCKWTRHNDLANTMAGQIVAFGCFSPNLIHWIKNYQLTLSNEILLIWQNSTCNWFVINATYVTKLIHACHDVILWTLA